MPQDEEEKKKREEEARAIISSSSIGSSINSINYANMKGMQISARDENEQNFINKVNEANSIINSINPRQNVPAPSISDEERERGHQNVQGLISLMDKNTQQDISNNDIQQEKSNPNANSRFRVNNTKSKEEVDQQIHQANSQNVQPNTNNENNNSIVDNDIKIGLASEQETQNAQELTQIDIEAMSEANRKNENIEKGGLAKFEEIVDTFFDNIIGGVKQTVSGLANVVTTGAALGLRGLEGAAGILGLEDASKSLNEAYNSTVEAGSNVNEIANYERTVNSQIDDDLTKTVGDVTNVISNMVSSQVIGYALPSNVPGVVIQGLSVGGNSAQEVLDENKDNIGQATLTGIAKGYTSYLTEKMFDANILTRGTNKTSIQESVDRLISNRISSRIGKEVANRTVGIIGENAEELVEDNVDNLIDKLINNKDLPDFKEWWDNTTETAKITTISTLIMSMLGLGGESFHDKEVDMEADYWIDQAQQIIEQEDMAIHFNPSEVKTMEDTKDFYITRFTPEGEIANVVATRGKTIANPNQELNVKPAIVRDNITSMYNVIDEDTGVVLDSTPYSTTMEAESGFDEKVNKLSDIQIKDINQKIDKASYTVTNQFARVIDEARNELAQMTPVDYGVNTRQNTQENQEQERQNFENINKTINQISDKSVYNRTAVDDLLNTVSNNINNVEYVQEDNGGGILYSFDNDRNITGQQNINGKVFSGKKIKSIVNTAIQKADTTSLYQETNTNSTQTISEPNTTTFYSNSTNYAVQDINKVTDPFSKQENYSRDELAETWNNEVSENNYDAYYDNNGSIKSYIAIEEDGNNIVVNQYNNNDEVVRSAVIPSDNGRYNSDDIKDTILKVSSNTDLSPYIQEMAANFEDDLNNTLPGERYKTGDTWTGQKRVSTKELVEIKDETGASWNKIGEVLDDIANGRNNNTKLARAIENKLDNALSEGYTNIYGQTVNPNEEYLEQKSKVYGRDFNNQTRDNYDPTENMTDEDFKIFGMKKKTNSSKNIDINKSIEKFEKAKNNIDRETVVNIANSLDIKIKEGATKIEDTNMSKLAGKNKTPSIITIDELFKDLTSKNIKEYRKEAENIANNLYRDKIVKIFDTQTDTEINKSGIEKTLSGNITKSKIQSINKLQDIIEQGIYGYTTYNPDDNNGILYHHFFTPVNYQNNNGLIRVVIREFTHDNSLNDKYYYHQLEFISNKKIEGINALPQINGNKEIKFLPSTKNSISQNSKTVKNETKTKTNKSQTNKTIKSLEDIKVKYKNQTDQLNIFENKDNTISINNLVVKQNLRNKGIGQNILNDIIDYADKNSKTITLTPTSQYLTKNRLTNWYKKNGFVENKGRNTNYSISDTMYRLPKTSNDDGVRAMKKNTSQNNTTQNNTSHTDNQGRTLSKQQQEYFKNSKVRDDNGNLQTVYHTTTNAGEQFNVFDPRNTDFYRFGNQIVNYYTDSKAMSGSYADGSYEMAETSKNVRNTKKAKRQYEGYINITNPYIVDAEGNNWNQVKTDVNEYGKKLLNEIDVLEKNNIYGKLKQMYDNVERTSQEASDRFYKIQKKAGLEQYDILGEYARWGNIDNIYENGLFNEQGKAAIANHINDTIDGKTLREIGLDLFNNKYETLLNKEIDKLKKQYPDIKDIPLEDFDIIAEHYDEGKAYIENRYRNQETTNDIVKKVIDLNNNGANYDGVIIKNVRDYGGGEAENYNPANVYVTFNSNQFKNVDNTKPTSNQDIRFAKKTAKTPKVEGEILDPGQTNAQRESNYIEQEIRKIEESGNWDDSIPVTRMTDIRKTIEDYLGIGVQKGHFRQQAYGIYKGNRDVIRTKELKDMDTILHETGHALDIGKRINLNKESIANELLTAVNKYGGYEAETRDVQLEEGFAEVIREYTIVPNQARIDYPQTVAVLEGIRQTDKDFNKFITDVQQQTYNYIHQNPRNRTLSNVSIGERTDQTKLTPAKIQQEVMRNIYDKDWALKSAVNEMQKINGKSTRDLKASENAYYLTRLSSGIGDKVISMLSKGYIDENGTKLMPGLEQLGEILGNNEQRFNDLRAYLVAQRDLEYKAKTLKTGIRTMDSKAVVEQFKNDTQIQEASKLVYDTLDGVMQYAVNNGLISQETADSLRESNAFYVPMQRVLEGSKNNVGRRGAVSDIIKARTGSELDVKDVLENIVANSTNIIQQVENNNILRALYNQGEQAGMTGKIYDVIDAPMVKIGTAKLSTWERELRNQGVDTTELDLEKTIDLFAPNNKVDTNNLITSFIDTNGKRVYLQFNDEVLFNSLMNMDKKFMSAVLNINRKLNMPLRYGATMANIGFAIPNMISDTTQAAIFSEAGFIPVVDNVIGIMDILSAQNKTARNFFNKVVPGYADRINTLYAIYEQTGATSSTRMSQYRETTQNLMKDVYGTKNSEVLGIKEKYKPLKRLLDIMTYIPEISEQSTRFRVFEKNIEYYRKNGMAETDARIQAALQSRDATQDFGRTGNITREINQLIPFSAARVGSAYTFAEKVKGNPKRVASRMVILMVISTAIKAIGYDDDEIEELNQRKKDDNFVLKIGDQIVTIKKPQGILRSIINLGEYVQDLFTGHIEEGKEGERLVELVQSAIMDNMPADSVTGLVPNMIAPVVENAINKDLYYNSDIVKSYDLELPDSEQYYDYNSQLAIWLGKIFNYSPAKIDNLISGYFAGLGTSVTNVIDWIAGKVGITAEEPNMGAEDNAVGKRFIVNVNSNSQSVDDVYTLKTDLTKKANGGTITEEEEKQLEALTEATSNMAKLNKQIKEIKKSLTLSADEKAEQIRVLQEQKTDTARQALGKELLYSNNEETIESTKFYPSRDTLSQNKRTLTLTSEMKKEYEEKAYEYYQKYEKQGLYSEEKLEQIKEKAKDYAKSYMMNKYKSELVRSEE